MKRTPMRRKAMRVSRLPVDVRREVLERDHYACQYCGTGATTIDHIVAKADRRRFGVSHLDTEYMVAACSADNVRKGSRRLVPPSWADRIPQLTEAFPGKPWRTWDGSTSSPAYREAHT